MDISYLGHASFKLRGRQSILITDPYDSSVGFNLPRVSADVVTVSHDHPDHNNYQNISGTARRKEPFIVKSPGEYEISGISVFGVQSFHDDSDGKERGRNTIFVIYLDDVTIVHLGDLGHVLTDRQVKEIRDVDVLLIPVGGKYTIGTKEALTVVNQLQPLYVIPMHYRTKLHKKETFGELSSVDNFLKEAGYEQAEYMGKLTVTKSQLPEEMEVIVLKS